MSQTDLFQYLSAFVTIVLAIALADMINSTHILIRARKRVVWDARPLVMAAIVALAVVSEFFSIWFKLDLEQVSMGRLLWLLITPTIFALLAYSALPDEVPQEGLRLADFWRQERRIWVAFWMVAVLLDLARGLEDTLSNREAFIAFLGMAGPYLVATGLGCALIFIAQGKRLSWLGIALLAASVIDGVAGWRITVQT
jgi:hypothetical protein